MTAGPDPAALLDLARDVAAEAAALAVQYRAKGVGDIGTKSTATDLVTAADRAVERLIADRLREHRPDDEILGEEYGAAGRSPDAGERRRGSVRWLVDPIDGTVNYVYGLPQYAVSLAAQVDGVTVVGVVRNAATGEQWAAVRGAGSWREEGSPRSRPGRDGEHRLTGSTETDLGHSLIATGFGYAADRREHQAGVLATVLPAVRDIRRFGAAALDLCFVAEGLVDAYFEKGLQPWDLAAGGLIAEEAGLVVAGLRGASPGPEMVLAAPPALYRPLHDLLVELDADGGP